MPEALLRALSYPVTAVGDLIAGGGPWVVWIFASGVVLWTIVLERYW
ncbi:MAG: MotA/TolQ/ExbB proton channel family protein, partial [Myxococcales bacterium]